MMELKKRKESNMRNEIEIEPQPVQPGSYSADALAASVSEKFAALFRQFHPPVPAPSPNPVWVGAERKLAPETRE
jgi:hypothetical protein